MVFSQQQRMVIVEGYLQSGSLKKTQKIFADKYPGTKPPAKRCIQSLVQKWRQTGSVENLKKPRPPSVRTPEVVRDIQQLITNSPQKSTRELSQQVGVSRTTCQRVLKLLKLKSYSSQAPSTKMSQEEQQDGMDVNIEENKGGIAIKEEEVIVKEEPFFGIEDNPVEADMVTVTDGITFDEENPLYFKGEVEGGSQEETSERFSSELNKILDKSSCSQGATKKFAIDKGMKGFKEVSQFESSDSLCSEYINKINCLKIKHDPSQNELPNTAKRFKCELCEKTLKSKDVLRKHLKIHFDEKQFVCEICSKAFSRKYDFNVHKLSHSNEKPYACKICGKTAITRELLKRHIRSHSSEKPFVCEICSKPFKQNSHLYVHKLSHSNEKLFVCHICNKSFNLKCVLNKHILSHSNEKPFACEVCGRSFKTKDALSQHARAHSHDKPFACEICEKTFKKKELLKSHEKTHSDERPFECEICTKSYKRKANLTAHISSHLK